LAVASSAAFSTATIIVGDLAGANHGGFFANRDDIGMFKADDRSHGADADGNCRLHGIAADAQQARRIGKREGAGGTERGVFAERVTGHECGIALEIEARFVLEHAHCRERDGHQCRLGILRQSEPVGRALPHDRGQLFTERIVHLGKHRAGGSVRIGQRLAHANGLAALPGKNKCRCHR
jgi:hypothetical protein